MNTKQLIETHKKHGDIYKNIESTQKELDDTIGWLEQNANSEAVSDTAMISPTRNKRDRLQRELDTMFATLKDLESAARNYINAERVAERAKEAAAGVDAVFSGMAKLKDIKSRFPKLNAASDELDQVKKDSNNAIGLFIHYSGIYHKVGS